MNLIVETDLGRDPDDFFAILYLVSAGVDIKCITVSPGDRDQIAVAKFLCKQLGLDIPVGAGHMNRGGKTSSGGIHYDILKKYGHSLDASPDGFGGDIITDVMKTHPDSELFVIGPLNSVRAYLEGAPKFTKRGFRRCTMQGGFVGYDIHAEPGIKRLPKFEGLTTCPTFNMNGDVKGTEALLASDTVRQFVGKNVCHTIIYNMDRHIFSKMFPPQNRAYELFHETMDMYLEKHGEKKFHDPTAAVCHLHPEIGKWLCGGQLFRANGGWGTKLGGPDSMLVDIDREKLWEYLWEGK